MASQSADEIVETVEVDLESITLKEHMSRISLVHWAKHSLE